MYHFENILTVPTLFFVNVFVIYICYAHLIISETIMTGIDSDPSDDSDRSSALFASFIKVHDNVTQFYTTNYKPIWKVENTKYIF